jgi:Ser/Thr protein kinase RdoA (MazF antagonist)
MKTNKKLIELVCNNYPNIKKTKKIFKLKQDGINSMNYLIIDGNSKYILKTIFDHPNPQKIEKTCRILNYCKIHNNDVTEPIKNKNGAYFTSEIKGYLTKYYEGTVFCGKKIEIKNLAINIASLHRTLSSCPISFRYKPNYFYYRVLKVGELNKIRKAFQNKKFRNKIDYFIIKNFPSLKIHLQNFEYFNKSIRKEKLSKQLIHYDLHPINVIFKNNKVSAIIDFDAMRKSYLIEEVAFASFRFAIFNNTEITRVVNHLKLFLKEYVRKNQLTPQELDCYFFFLRKNILEKISYIIKKYYFANNTLWISDLEKNFKFLKLIDKIELRLKKDGNFQLN